LALFQRAAAIRDAFFPAGGEPQIRFDITPQPPRDGEEPATLTLGGRIINTADGATGQASLTWPGADGLNPARLVFGQAGNDGFADAGGSIGASGPWALFRLLQQARISPSGRPQEFSVTFRSGIHEARFTLRAGSSRNPFGRNLLKDFRCPVLQ
jgi:type VI secretion system protein ImpL